MKKRGQITIFIVAGILLLLGMALILFMQQTTKHIKEKAQVPTDIVPVYTYIENCIKQIAEEDLQILGQTGGYLEKPKGIEPDAGIRYPFIDLMTPYWWYKNENRIPPPEYITYQLQNSMDKKLKECVNFNNFENYKFDMEDYSTEVTLGFDNIIYDVIWPMKITVGDKTTDIDRFTVTRDVRLKKILELAKDIMTHENEEGWFEDLTMELIALDTDIPLTNYQIKCTPLVWFVPQVKDKLKQLLEVNVPLVRIDNTDYRAIPDDQLYVKNHFMYTLGEKDYSNLHAAFKYDSNWNLNMDVSPSNGAIMQSGLQQGRDAKGVVDLSYLCLQIYHFTYDTEYPIMVSIRDDETKDIEEYYFQFAFPVVIQKNQASKETYKTRSFDFDYALTAEDYCSDRPEEMTVRTINKQTGLDIPDVNLSFTCIKYNCDIGTSDYIDHGAIAGIHANFPECGGGFVKGQAKSYKDGSVYADTQMDSLVTLEMTPIKDIYNFSVEKYFIDSPVNLANPLSQNEKALILISNDEHSTFGFYPNEENKPLTLLADGDFTYTLKIYLLKDEEFVGGYEGTWNPTDVSDIEEIKFKVTSHLNPIDENGLYNYFSQLPTISQQYKPELK